MSLAQFSTAELWNIAAKESQHSVALVSGINQPDGSLAIQANSGSPTWRAWFGRLSTTAAGCYAIRLDGTGISERIVVNVHAGLPPPG
jgi:hypothetical protein